MKRVLWHLLVVLSLALGLSPLVSAQAPVISALLPTQGPVNSSVTITGTGFGATQGNSKVFIGGVSASITTWSSGSILAVVPSSAPLGNDNVQVLVSNLYSNAVAFNVLPTPTITTLSINAGPIGAVITINGTNFGSIQSTSTVTFNGVTAIPNSWTNTAISVAVPQGATTGNIVVTVNGVPCDQPVAFMVVPPTPAGIGFVQGNYFAVQSSTLPSTMQTVTIPYPVAQTQHDLNVIVIGWRDTKYQVQSVTDTSGNTYSIAAPVVSLSGFGRQVIYYAPNISGASANSVTVTFTGAAHLPDIRISEYKGVVTANPLDVTAGKSATSGTLTDSGFVTTTNANDILVGANLVDSSINTTGPGTNYTSEVLTTPRYDIFEDRIVTATGSYNASAPVNKSGNWIAQMAAFKALPNQAPVVNAGQNQTIKLPTNTATLNGTVTDDGLPNNTLIVSWSQVSGPTGVSFSSPNSAVTQATFPGVGTYVLQLSASDSQLTSSATTTVTVIPAGSYTLTLSPPVAGPDVVGTSQALTAVLTNTSGATTTPVVGANVQFTVTGVNASSGTATTDSSGTATFTYTGGHSGSDSVQASYLAAGATSNTATVSWLVPSQPISTGTVFGRFFHYDSSGSFNATPATPPVFSQLFPTINFNPPAGTIPGNNSGVGVNTHPWTDVVTDVNGNFAGTIVAQGNGFQAGVDSMTNFQVVFTGTLTVPSAGNVTFNFYTDDGFILGIGGGATRVSGAFTNVPASGVTPFTNLPILGAYNVVTPPVGNTVVVNFPAAGTYNYELDYFECCGSPLVLTMTKGQTNTGIPPTGSLILTPTNPASLAAGQSQAFTVLASDASGAVVPNATINLVVYGANQLNLSSITDATGHATFQYTGANAGIDTLQASAIISGMGAYSNGVNMTWTPVADGLVVNAGPNQTIVLPTNTVTLNGSASEPGVPTSALLISWSEVSGPAPVTFSNPNQLTTVATFTVAGTYDLRLTASDTLVSRSSDVIITVDDQIVGNIEVCYFCSTNFGLGTFQDGPTFVIRNTGTAPMTGAVLRIGPGGGFTDSFNVGSIPAGGFVLVAPGLSNDGGTGHTFFNYLGGILDTSDSGPSGNDTQFEFTALSGGFQVDSGVFTPAATQGPSLDGTVANINFLGGPGNADAPCNNCFDKVVTNLGISTMPALIISKTHVDPFNLGQQNASYTVTVSNGPNSAPTSSAVTVTDTLPSGLTLVSMVGSGWTCSGTSCSRSDVLASGGSYPPITVTVNVASNASSPQNNTATVASGAFAAVTTTDFTTVTQAGPQLTKVSPGIAKQGQQNLTVAITGQSTHFVQGTTTAAFGAGITVTSLTINSATIATATVNVASNAPLGTSDVTLATGGEVATLTGGFGVISNGSSGSTVVFTPQGWIGSPTNGAIVQGQSQITVTSGVNLTSGTLTYWPLSNPSAVTTLNSNATGTGTVGTFDATLLPSGGYAIELNAVANGAPQTSYVTVTVVGDNKPGRITSTVTDFKVPLAGIPISITRTYDSLERSQSEDFGFGWKLGTTVGLSVDSKMDVTFNFNGQRETFYFQAAPQNVYFAWILYPQYVPQPGLHGTLTSDGCPAVWNVQGTIYCLLDKTPYQPTTYVYTDPVGRVYTISASGQLQSIKDLNGNTLTIAANGITSSVNGVVVPFVRDGAGRITQITDTNGKNYNYSYDQSGNLQSVKYPGLTGAETYTYFSDHTLQTDTDPRGNSSSATYYPDGRLQSITDGMHNTWNYSYNLATNTKTTTNPDGGVITETDDNFGKPLSITDPLNRTTTYVYDGNENLTSMTDPLHKTTSYTYDGNGFQTSVTDPLLHKSTKTYNQFGGVLTATDAANTNTQATTYDQNLNPVQVRDLLNGPGTFVSSATFDQSGNIFTFTDADQNTTQFGYDSNGNLNVVIDPLNEATHYLYDAMGRVTKYTDANQNATQFVYDDLGRLRTKTDALQNVTSYIYDDDSNKTSETDGNHHTTTYQYDALNRVSAVLYADNTSKSFTYDFRGNKLTEVDQLGHTTKYLYDLAGQLTNVTYAYGTPDAGTVSYTYDADGRQKTVTDELNHTTTYNYDDAGRLTSVQDALNNVTNYGYDTDNRQTSVIDANQHAASYAYDARGRLTATAYPIVPPATQATSSLAIYDGVGRLLAATDQAGNVTTKNYDLVGRLTSVMDPLHNTTRYGHDPAGNLTSVQDAAGRTTTYQYDVVNRRSTRTLPLSQLESYSYDGVGNLVAKTDFNQKKTTYSYDVLNRLLSKVPDASLNQPTVLFTYTSTGQRASLSDASGPTTYTYDNRDRVLSKVTPEGTLSYTYDAHGNLLTIASSNANGASMAYTYDALNRFSSGTDNRLLAQGASSAKTSYSYDPVGNVLNYTYPNTVQVASTFDPLNRLTQMGSSNSGNVLASYAYTLSPVGMRLSAAEQSGRIATYGYDNDYRLTSEAITNDPGGKNGTVNYTYDLVGNRTQQTSTLSGITGGSFSYNANDRLTSDAYDNNGNTIASGGLTYAYDFENRLLANGGLGLTYDGDGNRVSESVAGTNTKYLVDTLNPTGLPQVMDEIVSGSVTRTYAYGLQRISENQLIGGIWTPSFYGYDGHGNVRFLTNLAGTVTDTYQYDAFGNQVASTGTTPNSYLYSGERFDSSLGFCDFRACYYRSSTGRFWSRDSEEGDTDTPLSFNAYTYAWQDPTDRSDATGLSPVAAPVEEPPTLPPPTEPTQQQARPGGSALAEYAAALTISFTTYVAVEKLGCEVAIAYSYSSRRVVNDFNIQRDEERCTTTGEGRMRLQLQLGKQFTAPLRFVMKNQDPPGVTTAQVDSQLLNLWNAAKTPAARFPFNSLQRDLRSAIIEVGRCAHRYPPGGVIGGSDEGGKSVCSAEVDKSGWRVDLDNLNGHNLRQ